MGPPEPPLTRAKVSATWAPTPAARDQLDMLVQSQVGNSILGQEGVNAEL